MTIRTINPGDRIMIIVEKSHKDVAIISLKGRLVGPPETDELTERIKSIIENKTAKIVLDLRQVHWISSVGIGTIMRALTMVRKAGGDLRLSGLGDKVQDIFAITKIIGVIQAYRTAAEAAESFRETKKA